MSKYPYVTVRIIDWMGDDTHSWDEIYGAFSKQITRQQLNSILRRPQFQLTGTDRKHRMAEGTVVVRMFRVTEYLI